MKVEITNGEESWLEHATGDAQLTGYGCFEFEILIPTERGDFTMMVSPGNPCHFDVEEFRRIMDRLDAEALAR